MKHCHVTRDDTDSNKQDDAINGMMLANRLFNFTFSRAELVLHATNISIRRANKHIETESREEKAAITGSSWSRYGSSSAFVSINSYIWARVFFYRFFLGGVYEFTACLLLVVPL
jgi:hypothetical protein